MAGRRAAGSHVAAMDDRRRAREKRCVRSEVINRDYDNMRPKDNHELLKGNQNRRFGKSFTINGVILTFRHCN